ncbi:MAG: efflux RND transporter periplasmic adaptor subunit [Stenotrophobium sp.]
MKYFFPLLLLALAACSAKSEPEAPAPSALVQVVAVREMPLAQTLTAYGVAGFDPASTHTLAVQFEAQVASLNVAAGESVHAGEALMTLKLGATARLELDRLAREQDASARELERVKRLLAEGLATNTEVQTAELAAASAREAHTSLAARTGNGLLTLRAPASGVVDTLPFAPGDIVTAGSVVARIGAADHLRVRLGVEPEDIAALKSGADVQLRELHDGKVESATHVAAIDRRVDPQTRLADALVNLPAGTPFLPGEALQASIVLARRDHALAVPRSAVLYDSAHDNQPYVFIAAGGKAQRRNVGIGLDDGHDIEIVHGLSAGEQVVSQGNYELADGMAIRIAPAIPVSAPAASAAP